MHLPDFFLYSLSETERELGSIYSGYDYTRTETGPYGCDAVSLSADSVEDGVDYLDDHDDGGTATVFSAGAEFRSSYHGFRIVEGPEVLRPKPLESRRKDLANNPSMPSIHREMRLSTTSDVPTSEQTYGETNQLLMITPNNDPSGGRCNPLTCTKHPHIHRDNVSPATTIGYYEHDDKENTPPGLDFEGFARAFSFGSPDPRASMREGSMVMSPSIISPHRDSRPPHFRTSSIYPESDWVTQRSESPGLTETDDEDDHSLNFQRTQESRQSLAATPFPSLDNPNPEVSPLRPRGQGRAGRKQTNSFVPPIPEYYIGGDTDDEMEPVQSEPSEKQSRRNGLLPKKLETRSNPGDDRRSIDFTSEPTGDARRVLSIISGKAHVDHLHEPRYCSPGDRTSRQIAKLQELESIRVSNPDAVKEATARFQHHSLPNFVQSPSPTPAKLKKTRNPFVRQEYKPSKSFQKAAAIGRHDIAHGSFSSQKGLLSPNTPSRCSDFSIFSIQLVFLSS
jgi:hypothetical protein